MLNSFAKSETQASKAAKVCPHAQVGAFDVRRTDSRFVGVSADYDRNGCGDLRWLIPVRPIAALRTVELDQLSEVNVRTKIFFDGGNVTAETVRRKLESSGDTLAQ